VGRGRTYDETRGNALHIPALGKPVNGLLRRALLASVPKSWFSHLYHVAVAWNLMWIVILASHVYCLPDATSVSKLMTQLDYRNTVVALVCIQVHVTRRLWENYFVHKHSPGARMQMLAYALALCYYIFLPSNFMTPRVVKSLTLDFFLTGDTDTCVLEQFQFFVSKVLSSFEHKKQFLLIGIFLFGNVMQYQCHRTLASLRRSKSEKKKKKEEGSTYSVPRGVWFNNNSNPHYLAEVILYAAFISLANMWNTKTWLLMGMVVMNLLQSAVLTHKWYKKEFKDYPKQRYAMFPMLV
jgi:3-oxo-5-alpha-steroid 4-dehydrogenase 3